MVLFGFYIFMNLELAYYLFLLTNAVFVNYKPITFDLALLLIRGDMTFIAIIIYKTVIFDS